MAPAAPRAQSAAMENTEQPHQPANKAETASWAKDAVDTLVAKCLRAAAMQLQTHSEELLMEMLRRGQL